MRTWDYDILLNPERRKLMKLMICIPDSSITAGQRQKNTVCFFIHHCYRHVPETERDNR